MTRAWINHHGRCCAVIDPMPSDADRATLRASGLRYHPQRKRWQGPKGEPATAEQLRAVYLVTGLHALTTEQADYRRAVGAWYRLRRWIEDAAAEWARADLWLLADLAYHEWVLAAATGAIRPAIMAPFARRVAALLPRSCARDVQPGVSRAHRRLLADVESIEAALRECGERDAWGMLTGVYRRQSDDV